MGYRIYVDPVGKVHPLVGQGVLGRAGDHSAHYGPAVHRPVVAGIAVQIRVAKGVQVLVSQQTAALGAQSVGAKHIVADHRLVIDLGRAGVVAFVGYQCGRGGGLAGLAGL